MVGAALALLMLTLPGSSDLSCHPVRLDEAHNAFSPAHLLNRSQYSIAPCVKLAVDVSDYVVGGSALAGRPAANLLTVYVSTASGRIEIRRMLNAGERVVDVDLDTGVQVEGDTRIRRLEAGQRIEFVIGVKSDTNFQSYSMSGGTVSTEIAK